MFFFWPYLQCYENLTFGRARRPRVKTGEIVVDSLLRLAFARIEETFIKYWFEEWGSPRELEPVLFSLSGGSEDSDVLLRMPISCWLGMGSRGYAGRTEYRNAINVVYMLISILYVPIFRPFWKDLSSPSLENDKAPDIAHGKEL